MILTQCLRRGFNRLFQQDCCSIIQRVRHLGGRWVPRQRLDEVQVVIGSTAWLPFLRARHLMEALRKSRDNLMSCSLTQLYFTAAREAASPS